MRLSIRWKLLLAISLPLLISYSVMLAVDYHRVREKAVAQVQTLVLERAQTSADGVNARLTAVSQSVESLVNFLGQNFDAGNLRVRLQFALGRPIPFALATHAIYDDAGGSLTRITQRRGFGAGASSIAMLADDAALETLYRQVELDGKPRWSNAHLDPMTQQNVYSFIDPLVQNQKVRAAVVVDINVNDLLRENRFGRRGGRSTAATRPTPPTSRHGVEPATAQSRLNETRDAWVEPPDEPGGRGRRGEGWQGLRERFSDRRDSRRAATQPAELPPFGRGDEPRLAEPPPDFLSEEIGPTTGTSLDPDANAIELIDRDGKPVLMRTRNSTTQPASILQWADEHNLLDFIKAYHAAQDGEGGIAQVPNLGDIAPMFRKGETYWIALAPIRQTGWVYVASIPETQVIGPLLENLRQRVLFLAAGLIVILIVAMVIAFRLSRPIRHMAAAVHQLAEGNLDTRVTEVKSQDELGQLARAFNAMTGQLKSYVRELTEQTKVREKSESELRIARQIQTDLLPRTFPPFPNRPEFDLHAVNIPAAGVAGDFYDFFFVADDWLTICIADVSGKGVPAALLMAVTRTIVRNLALAGLPLEQIGGRANEMLLADTNNQMFVTMFLAQYHPATGRLRYVNAGHPRPFIFRRGGAVELFGDVTAPLLGVCEACEIGPVTSAETILEVGQTLLLYTDGVTEARAADDAMLREAGAMRLIHEHDGEDVATFCGSMVAAIDAYQDHRPADDITMLALRRKA